MATPFKRPKYNDGDDDDYDDYEEISHMEKRGKVFAKQVERGSRNDEDNEAKDEGKGLMEKCQRQ